MISEKNLLAAEKLARDSRLPAINSFARCAQACLAEWIQLLMVIERIKASKTEASTTLMELVSLADVICADKQVIDYITSDPSRFAFSNDLHWNPQTSDETKCLNLLQSFFIALDKGQTQGHYFTQAGKDSRDNPRNRDWRREVYDSIQCEVIPGILDNHKFSWSNLNSWRLHYPHEVIIRAIKYHTPMMVAINDLRTWKDQEFLALKIKILKDFLDSKEIILNDSDKAPSAAQIRAIHNKLMERLSIQLVSMINVIPASIGIRNYHPTQNRDFPLTATKAKEVISFYQYQQPEEDQDVITIKIDANTLQQCIDNNEEGAFLMTFNEKLIGALSSDCMRQFGNILNSRLFLPSPVRFALDYTLRWTNDDVFMLPTPFGSRINEEVLLTGLMFSHWLWEQRNKGKLTIRKGTIEYYEKQKKLNVKPNASTIEQYYVLTRRWCKESLNTTVKEQLRSRVENITMIRWNLLWPLNFGLIKNYNDFITSVYSLVDSEVNYGCDVDKIISISSYLRGFIKDATDQAVLGLGEYLYKQLGVEHSDWNAFKPENLNYLRSKLQKLVDLNIDMGWGDDTGNRHQE